MPRPLLLRALPASLRLRAWSRFYRGKHGRWASLYRRAPLTYGPDMHMDLIPGDAISDPIAFCGVYEPDVTRRVVQLAQRGGIMIDVGANLGYFSLLWAANCPINRVFAFEASPRNIPLLRQNVESNVLEDRITIVPKAAGLDRGKASFDLGPSDQTGWGGITAASKSGTVEVEVVRVDEKVDDEITLLKIDIEGADTWALMGCERLLRAKSIREIWWEQNKPRMQALGIAENEAQDYLRSVGYEARPLSDPSADLVEWIAVPA